MITHAPKKISKQQQQKTIIPLYSTIQFDIIVRRYIYSLKFQSGLFHGSYTSIMSFTDDGGKETSENCRKNVFIAFKKFHIDTSLN